MAASGVHALGAQMEAIQRKYKYQIHETERLKLQAEAFKAQLDQRTQLQDAMAASMVVLLQHVNIPSFFPAVRALLQQYVEAKASKLLIVDERERQFLVHNGHVPLRGLAYQCMQDQKPICITLRDLGDCEVYCEDVDIKILQEYSMELVLMVVPIYDSRQPTLPCGVLELMLNWKCYTAHKWRAEYVEMLTVHVGACIQISLAAMHTTALQESNIACFQNGISQLMSATNAHDLVETLTTWLEKMHISSSKKPTRWIEIDLVYYDKDTDTIVVEAASRTQDKEIPLDIEKLLQTLTASRLSPTADFSGQQRYIVYPAQVLEKTYGFCIKGDLVPEDIHCLDNVAPVVMQFLHQLLVVKIADDFGKQLAQLMNDSSSYWLYLHQYLDKIGRSIGVEFIVSLPKDVSLLMPDKRPSKVIDVITKTNASKSLVEESDEFYNYIAYPFHLGNIEYGVFGVVVSRAAPALPWLKLVLQCSWMVEAASRSLSLNTQHQETIKTHEQAMEEANLMQIAYRFLSMITHLHDLSLPGIMDAVNKFYCQEFDATRATIFLACGSSQSPLFTWFNGKRIEIFSGIPIITALSRTTLHGSRDHPAFDNTFDKLTDTITNDVVCYPLSTINGCIEIATKTSNLAMEKCTQLLESWLPQAIEHNEAFLAALSDRSQLINESKKALKLLEDAERKFRSIQLCSNWEDLMGTVGFFDNSVDESIARAHLFIFNDKQQLWTLNSDNSIGIMTLEDEPYISQALNSDKPISVVQTEKSKSWLSPILNKLHRKVVTSLLIMRIQVENSIFGVITFSHTARVSIESHAKQCCLLLGEFVALQVSQIKQQQEWTYRMSAAQDLAILANQHIEHISIQQTQTELQLLEQCILMKLVTFPLKDITTPTLIQAIESTFQDKCTPSMYFNAQYFIYNSTQHCFISLQGQFSSQHGILGHILKTGRVVTTSNYDCSTSVLTNYPLVEVGLTFDMSVKAVCGGPIYDDGGNLHGAIILVSRECIENKLKYQYFEAEILPSIGKAFSKIYLHWKEHEKIRLRTEELGNSNHKTKEELAMLKTKAQESKRMVEVFEACLGIIENDLQHQTKSTSRIQDTLQYMKHTLQADSIEWFSVQAIVSSKFSGNSAALDCVMSFYAQLQTKCLQKFARSIHGVCLSVFETTGSRQLNGIIFCTGMTTTFTDNELSATALGINIVISALLMHEKLITDISNLDERLVCHTSSTQALQAQISSVQRDLAFAKEGYQFVLLFFNCDSVFKIVSQELPKFLQFNSDFGPTRALFYAADHGRRILRTEDKEIPFGEGHVGMCVFNNSSPTLASTKPAESPTNLHDMYIPMWQSKDPTILLGVLEIGFDSKSLPVADYLAIRQRAKFVLEDLQLSQHIEIALTRLSTNQLVSKQLQLIDQRQSAILYDTAKKLQIDLAAQAALNLSRTIQSIQQRPTKREFWVHALEGIEQSFLNFAQVHEAQLYIYLTKESLIQRGSNILTSPKDVNAIAMVHALAQEDRIIEGLRVGVVKQPCAKAPNSPFDDTLLQVFTAWSMESSDSREKGYDLCLLKVKCSDENCIIFCIIVERALELSWWWLWMKLYGSVLSHVVQHTLELETISAKYCEQKLRYLSDSSGVSMDLLQLISIMEAAHNALTATQMICAQIKSILHASRVDWTWCQLDDQGISIGTKFSKAMINAMMEGENFYRSSERCIFLVLRNVKNEKYDIGVVEIELYDDSVSKLESLWKQLALVISASWKLWHLKNALNTAEQDLMSQQDCNKSLDQTNAELMNSLQQHHKETKRQTSLVKEFLNEIVNCLALLQSSSYELTYEKLGKILISMPTIKACRVFELYSEHLELVSSEGCTIGPTTRFSGHPGLAGHLAYSNEPIAISAKKIDTTPYRTEVDGGLAGDEILGFVVKSSTTNNVPLALIIHTSADYQTTKSENFIMLKTLLDVTWNLYFAQKEYQSRQHGQKQKEISLTTKCHELGECIENLHTNLQHNHLRLECQRSLLAIQPKVLNASSIAELAPVVESAFAKVVHNATFQLFWCQRDHFFWVDPSDRSQKQLSSQTFVDQNVQKAMLSGVPVATLDSSNQLHKLIVPIRSNTTNHLIALLQISRHNEAITSVENEQLEEITQFIQNHIERLIAVNEAKKYLNAAPHYKYKAQPLKNASYPSIISTKDNNSLSSNFTPHAPYPSTFLQGFLGITTLLEFKEAVSTHVPCLEHWVGPVQAVLYVENSTSKPFIVEWYFDQVKVNRSELNVLHILSVHEDFHCRRDLSFWVNQGVESIVLFELRAQAHVALVVLSATSSNAFGSNPEQVIKLEVAQPLTKVFSSCIKHEIQNENFTSQRAIYDELTMQIDDLVEKCSIISEESQLIQKCLGMLGELATIVDEASLKQAALEHLAKLFPSYHTNITTEKPKDHARWCMPLGQDLFVSLFPQDKSDNITWTPTQDRIWIEYTCSLSSIRDRLRTTSACLKSEIEKRDKIIKHERASAQALLSELEASQETIQQLQLSVDELMKREGKHRELKLAQKQWLRREKDLELKLMQQSMELQNLRQELEKERRQVKPVLMNQMRYRGLGHELKELATLEASQVQALQEKAHRTFQTQT